MTAVIRWKSPRDSGRRTPPGADYRTIAHFEADKNWPNPAWTLVVNNRWFSPAGEITVPEIQVLVDDAPQHLLAPGAKFELVEGNRAVASGVVMPAERTLEQIEQLAQAI